MTTLPATSGAAYNTVEYWPQLQNPWPYTSPASYPVYVPYPVPQPVPISPCIIIQQPAPCSHCRDEAEAKLLKAARELLEARGYVVVAPAGETG